MPVFRGAKLVSVQDACLQLEYGMHASRSVHTSAKIALAAKHSDTPPVLVFGGLRLHQNIPRVESVTRFSRQNRGGSLPALDDEYRFVVNGIGFTDLL